MKPKEIIKKYEKKKAENINMIESAKGNDAKLNKLWLYRINELFDGFIDDVKKLNEGMRKCSDFNCSSKDIISLDGYSKESALTEYEYKLEQVVDMIHNEPDTLLAIKKLERCIEQLKST